MKTNIKEQLDNNDALRQPMKEAAGAPEVVARHLPELLAALHPKQKGAHNDQ